MLILLLGGGMFLAGCHTSAPHVPAVTPEPTDLRLITGIDDKRGVVDLLKIVARLYKYRLLRMFLDDIFQECWIAVIKNEIDHIIASAVKMR